MFLDGFSSLNDSRMLLQFYQGSLPNIHERDDSTTSQIYRLPKVGPFENCPHQRWDLSGPFLCGAGWVLGLKPLKTLRENFSQTLQGWTFFGGFPSSEDAGSSCWRTHSFTQPGCPGPGSHRLVWIRVLSSFFTPQKIKDNTATNNTNPPL